MGGGRIFDRRKIEAFVEGVRNVLTHYRVTKGEVGRTAKDSNALVGNDLEIIRSSTGGLVELLVKLGEKVEPGQRVAVQRNSFGDVVAEYKASVEGEVAILATDAVQEPGARLMEILTNSSDAKCADGGCPYEGESY